jgi:peptidoglycan lytic transglycosylase G
MSGDAAHVEPKEKPARRSCLRTLIRLCFCAIVLVLLGALVAALAGYVVYDHVTRPGVPGAPVRVDVPAGATGQGVGRVLHSHGLVEHDALFRLAIHLDTSGKTIKHGAYDLPRGLSPTQLLQMLQEGPNTRPSPDQIPDDRKVTVPEGLSLVQMAALFEDPDAFLAAARAPELVERIGIDAGSIEGCLMPNTYFFDAKPSEREVVERMVDQFLRELDSLLATLPEARDQDLLQWLTIASLIEEEARVDDERPLVSAVIRNRLDKGMRLDLDCTLQYALGKYGQRLLDEDKAVDSPYNTYKHKGLPPGPICSPGVKSLVAALAPADTEHLYFVSNADGLTHTFSRTLAEHNRATARYRKEMANQRREQRDATTTE